MSFKCHFDVDGGIEKQAWLPPRNGLDTYLECEPFMVIYSTFFVNIVLYCVIYTMYAGN